MKIFTHLLLLVLFPTLLFADTYPGAYILDGVYQGQQSRDRITIINHDYGIMLTGRCRTTRYRPNRDGVLSNRSRRQFIIPISPGVIEIRDRRGRGQVYVARGHRNDFRPGNRRYSIEGDWFSNQYRRSMQIELSRDGIKARDERDRRWTRYTQTRNRQNEYIDARGNRIIIRSNNRIKWIGFNGLEINFRRNR